MKPISSNLDQERNCSRSCEVLGGFLSRGVTKGFSVLGALVKEGRGGWKEALIPGGGRYCQPPERRGKGGGKKVFQSWAGSGEGTWGLGKAEKG